MFTDEAIDISDINKRLKGRLEVLSQMLANPYVNTVKLGPVRFLSNLLHRRLRGLKFDSDLTPASPGDAMTYAEDGTQRRLVLSMRLRQAMQQVAKVHTLSSRQIDWMIDNFYIHELLHFGQGMAGGNHSQLRTQSEPVLLAIDYQADAVAVVTAAILAWIRPDLYGYETSEKDLYADTDHWTLLAAGIRATLLQMEVFTTLSSADLQDRSKVASWPASLERIQRIATWHLQYHRVEMFNRARPLADFQILAQPMLDFRYLAAANTLCPELLTRTWPSNEAAAVVAIQQRLGDVRASPYLHASYEKRSDLIVTGTTPVGTTMFYRHSAAQPDHYSSAFEGFFEARTGKSRDFFRSMLEHCRWWIGYDSGWGGGGTGGPDPTDPKSPSGTGLDEQTKGLALDLDENKRVELLKLILMPEQRPLVVMENGPQPTGTPLDPPLFDELLVDELQLEPDLGISGSENRKLEAV